MINLLVPHILICTDDVPDFLRYIIIGTEEAPDSYFTSLLIQHVVSVGGATALMLTNLRLFTSFWLKIKKNGLKISREIEN